jgi:hypothetical protein
MRDRAVAGGGTLDVTGGPGRGTTVRLVLPLPGGPGAGDGTDHGTTIENRTVTA